MPFYFFNTMVQKVKNDQKLKSGGTFPIEKVHKESPKPPQKSQHAENNHHLWTAPTSNHIYPHCSQEPLSSCESLLCYSEVVAHIS